MSFEGFYQYWCTNGHYSAYDAYCMYDDTFVCPICGATEAFSNLVDTTNGSYDYDESGNEIRIDRYIEPEVVVEAPTCTCHCGHVHTTGPATYKIPNAKDEGDDT